MISHDVVSREGRKFIYLFRRRHVVHTESIPSALREERLLIGPMVS